MNANATRVHEGRAIRRARRRGIALLVALMVVFGLGAGAYFGAIEHTPAPLEPRPAAPVPEELDRALRCDDALPLEVHLEAPEDRDGIEVLEGRFLARRIGVETPHEVRFAFYRAAAAKEPAPAFIVTPILGGRNEVARLIARDLVTHGMHALIVDRVVPSDARRLAAWEEALSDLVADRRRALDWLVSRPEVDPERIGAYGVSLGAITTVLLKALEPRIRLAVVVMAGGDLPSVIARSVEPECRLLRQAHGLGDRPSAEQIARFEARAREVIRTDPLRLARHIDPREVLMFLTRRDTSVDSAAQRRLWEALGRPECYSLPTGHYSAIVYLPVITARARAFIAAHFESTR